MGHCVTLRDFYLTFPNHLKFDRGLGTNPACQLSKRFEYFPKLHTVVKWRKICRKFISRKTDYSRCKHGLPVPFMGRNWRPGDRLWTALKLMEWYISKFHLCQLHSCIKSRYKGILLENILMEGNMAFIHDTNSVSMWPNISTFPYSRITKMYAQFGGIRIFLKRALRIVVYCAIGNVDKTIYGYGIHKSRWNSHADCYHY